MVKIKKTIRNIYVSLSGGDGNFICGDSKRRVRRNRVNLHYWRPTLFSDNLGDYLSKVIVDFILKEQKLSLDQPVKRTRHLLAIGSILGFNVINATVWGSGMFKNKEYENRIKKSKYDIRAVRGPETKKQLESFGLKCPDIMGDPAILLPLFYKPNISPTKDFAIIPRFLTGFENYKTKYPDNVLDIETNKWQSFVDELLLCKVVISSSLHGIILADAYGIPAILLDAGDFNRSKFKYNDYYYSTERYTYKVASNVEDALSMSPERIPQLDSLRDNLLSVFPYDLWND